MRSVSKLDKINEDRRETCLVAVAHAPCLGLCVFELVKVVLVELANKRGEIGVLEHAGQDRLGEFGHVFDDEAVALRPPCDDVRKLRVLEHPAHE